MLPYTPQQPHIMDWLLLQQLPDSCPAVEALSRIGVAYQRRG